MKKLEEILGYMLYLYPVMFAAMYSYFFMHDYKGAYWCLVAAVFSVPYVRIKKGKKT